MYYEIKLLKKANENDKKTVISFYKCFLQKYDH